MPNGHDNRRQYFRLDYPEPERPWFVMGKMRWLILDLSEGGARVAARRRGDPNVMSALSGEVLFRDGEKESVSGTVIRTTKTEWIVKFETGVPFARMMQEQRRIFGLRVKPKEDD